MVWVEFPARGGHAQQGRRPAIIMQGPIASAKLPTILVVPLTTQLDALRFPGTVLVEAEAGNGLRRNSVALVFQMTVIDQRLLGNRIGQVSEAILNAIRLALQDLSE